MLTPGIYGVCSKPKVGPFELKCGQTIPRGGFCKNHGWYNRLGEPLGWGDLTTAQLQTISDEIPDDEVFVTISQQDTWENDEQRTLTPEQLAKVAVLVMTQHRLYRIDQGRNRTFDGVVFEHMDREELAELLQSMNAVNS